MKKVPFQTLVGHFRKIAQQSRLLVLRFKLFTAKHRLATRLTAGGLASLMVFYTITEILLPHFNTNLYSLKEYDNRLIQEPKSHLGEKLKFDRGKQEFIFNGNYEPAAGEVAGTSSHPKITASFSAKNDKTVTVTDPVNQIGVSFTPKFNLHAPKQDQNRVVYPLSGLSGVKVYTAQAIGVKEDIILDSYGGDELTLDYKLGLPEGTQARIEPNGSLAVYGVNSHLLGEVSTGSEKDKKLLQDARKNGDKTNLLFQIPAPVVIESGKKQSKARASFELKDNILSIRTKNLKQANFPLSIDPSVYVETATQLMRGNNETNVDFDVNNELIQKGSTTGARFDSLDATLSLPSARWNHATAVAGGYTYVVGGNDGSSNQATVYWAKFDSVNYDIDAPNPGNGACANWCTDSDYDLPAARAGLSLVAYNGYLYAIGGTDSSCTTGNGTGDNSICDTVYIAKIGANGEPQLWHPTDDNQANWNYWHRAGDLSTERRYTAAAAYNNRLYLLGGQTDSAGTPTAATTVEKSDISPAGDLGSWSSTGMTALPSARYGHSTEIYNDYIYLIGGHDGSSLQSSVNYIKINSDGTMAGSWAAANSFGTARMSWGGKFTAMWGAYIYVMGGCAAVDAEGECTSTGITNGGLIELASINADGSMAFWGTINNITHSRIGYGLVAWRNTIYSVGGCTAQNATTGACTTTIGTSHYGIVNGDGDASTVGTSVNNATAPCTGGSPYDCNLPGTSYIGNMLSSTAIMNGYLYIIGGCTNNGCTTTSGNTIFTAIGSDGSLTRPASCTGGSIVDSYCVDSTDPISGGVAAAGTAIFGGRIYVVGGQSGSALKGNIYHVEILNDGSLNGAWTAQSFTNIGATSVSYTFAYARANPSSAGTYPGNLYIIGGCDGSGSGVACASNDYTGAVYKCNILATGSLEEVDLSDCDTTNQLQIGTVPGASGAGLALHAGTVYANYIYLVGGAAPGIDELTTVRYAKFDNSNNIVAVSGGAWKEAVDSNNDPIEMSTGRSRLAAFGYNGHLYAVGGYDSGSPGTDSDIQFAKINVSDGSLDYFETSVVTFNQRWGVSVPVSNSYAYIIGGCTTGDAPGSCTARTDVMQTFQIYNNESGSPENYGAAANLFPTDRFGASAAINNGYMYVAGGCIGVLDCENATNVVEYAQLNSDGTVGTWASTTALTADRVYGQLEAVGGTLYYIGGQIDDGTAQTTVYYTTPNSNGTITSWSTATNALPAARSLHGASVWNGRIYVAGGRDGSSVYNTVYYSPNLSSGGDITAAWSTAANSFNVARSGLTAITYANNLYILGGYDGINYLSDTQYTQINSDGTLDSWSYSTSLPRNVSQADGFAANGYMYIFGGKQSDIVCTNNTYVAPISANTTIASGNNPTGIGEWYLTNERFTAERSDASALYHEGKAYVLGGKCGTFEGLPGTIAMEDDFDATIDATMWTSTTGMAANTDCGTLVSGNALTSGGNSSAQAISKDVDVLYGGSITFYLRIPTTTSGACDAPENAEDLELQYSTNGGSGWSTFATYDESNFNTATQITESIPQAARTSATRFRWYMPAADNNQDDWAIDAVEIEANDIPPLDILMEDDFDPSLDTPQWSSTTGMSTGITCGTIGTSNALYSTGGTAEAATNDLVMIYGSSITFTVRVASNSSTGCDQPEATEVLELQYSLNSGTNWTSFATFSKDIYDPAKTVTLALPQAAYSDSTRLRWVCPLCDGSADQWAIDDVSIEAFNPILQYTNQNRVVYTSLLSQPQVAKYSRMIDADSDVFPNNWLMNGLDNDIGARWTMRYRSMTNTTTNCTSPAMTNWGQETNFGTITLGDVVGYTPLDGSGANTNCARFFYFFVNIDSSKAFGYPEDVTRGPTIYDMSLYYTSDPNKRLMHGKTFIGGEQQPLDTPCRQTNDPQCALP